MKRSLLIVAVVGLLIGCTNDFRNIPAGFVAKKLTPSGWDKGILEAGQVDIGTKNSDGTYTSLVLLEATAVTIKESFQQANANNANEDDRIIIGKTPVTVDAYIRMAIPQEPERRNALFAQITPAPTKEERISAITVDKVYTQFAKMDIRSGIRATLQTEDDVYKVIKNLGTFNDRLGAMAKKVFENTGVPLDVQNITLSNIKVDASVWDAENKKAAALAQVEAINKVGAALQANPDYKVIKKYDTYEKIAESGKVSSFTIIDGAPGGIVIGK